MEEFKLSSPEKPNLPALLDSIQAADERPSTEKLENLKAELIQLAQQAKRAIEKQDVHNTRVISLNPLHVPEKGAASDEWYVVGDLHGDFNSLSRILLKIYLRPGIDPDRIKIIFLGDYIDRGARPFEVLKLLLGLKIKWPEHFWLLRGNHECLVIRDDGIVQSMVNPHDTIDFWKEHVGEDVFKALARLFDALPAAFVQPLVPPGNQSMEETEKILYVHGGIPRTEHLQLPLEAPECQDGFLWSDPETEKGDVLNGPARRFSFGRKDFLSFTERHNISLIVRGHELRKNGFDLHEELKNEARHIVTIFSCGGRDNEDSFYGSDVLVPRFLSMHPAKAPLPPYSVEEVYRDDFTISDEFHNQHNAFTERFIAGVRDRLAGHTGITFNLLTPSAITETEKLHPKEDFDVSNTYDSGNFTVSLTLTKNSINGGINCTILINNQRKEGLIKLIEGHGMDALINPILEQVNRAYPIFGKLPQRYFSERKESAHA